MGDLVSVQKAVESGNAPDLLGHETPYQWGYVALTLFGAQRLVMVGMGTPPDHIGKLKYLLKHGAPPDIPDILGYIILHACMARPRADWQDWWDSVALIAAFQNNTLDSMDVFVQCRPHVTALVQKWKRRRAGIDDPLDAKACAACGKLNVWLKWCEKHGPIHKKSCVPFSTESTVTLKPVYDDGISPLSSSSEIARYFLLGQPMAHQTTRNSRGAAIPRIPQGQTTTMIVKVQVPFDYKTDNPDGYQRISEVVWTKGVMGAKAYFPVEMKAPDELAVKICEVLAEQAFSVASFTPHFL
ncbi:hypothetical protein C8Q79DRAFT_1007247 [Trametes meyenii]|nr:hypothetical protein C8Q79DRAFT_1007247 [Trametes meyenii]